MLLLVKEALTVALGNFIGAFIIIVLFEYLNKKSFIVDAHSSAKPVIVNQKYKGEK